MSPGPPSGGGFRGHRATPLGRSPFGDAVPAVVTALAYGAVALVWIAVGPAFPGGRWFAVHVFTLGVLTNVVLAFSQHFARTLTRAPGVAPRWPLPVLNLGIVLVLVGLPAGQRWSVALGATTVTAVVVAASIRLRALRRAAVGARFGWIVRIYERAHGAFVHGAVLGALLGTGLLTGPWYLSARHAHLHVNVLGWGGLTLLATFVFFGPTMARTRIEPGADARAARAIRHGATGLTVAVLALLVTAVGGTAGTLLRVLAAGGLTVFAWATAITCIPVARAAARANRSATRPAVMAVALWFPTVAWLDVVVVATGRWAVLTTLGLAALLGVLAQAIVTVLTYLAPMLRARGFAGRDVVLARLEVGAGVRVTLFNVAVVAIATGPLATTASLARVGWVTLAAVLVWTAAAALWRLPDGQEQVRSAVARRYRAPGGTSTEDG